MMSLQLEPDTKLIGTPDNIPEAMDPECQRLFPEHVRKRLDWEELNGVQPKPGICRFCRRQLPIAYTQIYDMRFPVVQCDRVARMWPEADAIRKQRIAQSERDRRKAAEAAKAGRKPKPEEWI